MEETICAVDTLCIAPGDEQVGGILLGDFGEGKLKLQICAHERFLMTGTFMRFIINKKEIEKGD